MTRRTGVAGSRPGRDPGTSYHRRVIDTPSVSRHPASRSRELVRLEPLSADVASVAPMDAAEAFRDLPGLALLESARPGRRSRWSYLCADPVALLEAPADGTDVVRRCARRCSAAWPATAVPVDADDPRRRAAVPRRARRVSRVRPRARLRTAPDTDEGRSGPASAPPRRCTTGRSPGTGGPGGRGSAAAPWTATPPGWSGASPRSGSAFEPRSSGTTAPPPALPRRACASRRASTGRTFEAGVEADPRRHRPRRDLPGQPHAAAPGAVPGRPVGALPAASGPATRRSSRRTSTWAPRPTAMVPASRGPSPPRRRNRSWPSTRPAT